MVLAQLGIRIQEERSRCRLYTLHKIKSQWSRNLNVKCKTMKLLENNTKETLDDFWYDGAFLHTTPKSWSMIQVIGAGHHCN